MACDPFRFFRRRTADLSPYDGQLRTARRTGPEEWDSQLIYPHGNVGFYPSAKLGGDGNIEDLFHFDFSGFHLLHSLPNTDADAVESTGPWNTERLGRVGDGLRLQHDSTKNGVEHLLFQWNPINEVGAPRVYGRLTNRGFEREVVDPFAFVSNLTVTSSGGIFVWSRKQNRNFLLQREGDDWRTFCEVPAEATGSFDVVDKNNIFVGPQWIPETREIFLWHKQGKKWSREVIARDVSETRPNWLQLLRDQNGQLAVVLGQVGKPYGWLKLLTQK